MNTVRKMRAALAGAITVRTWWGCPGLSGAAFRSWFHDRLMEKINRDDMRQWRRLTPEFQASLHRDARRLTDMQHRIIHRQFETDICQSPVRTFVNHRLMETHMTYSLAAIDPFYAACISMAASPAQAEPAKPIYARLPLAPITASPVPHLTSLYHFHRAGEYGDRAYPGNCGGNLIKDLLLYFKPTLVLVLGFATEFG